MMSFENVGFTNAVSTSFKYLTCAACDRGPLGVHLIQEAKYYIVHPRIAHSD